VMSMGCAIIFTVLYGVRGGGGGCGAELV
jgi:hypothetical protein